METPAAGSCQIRIALSPNSMGDEDGADKLLDEDGSTDGFDLEGEMMDAEGRERDWWPLEVLSLHPSMIHPFLHPSLAECSRKARTKYRAGPILI